MERVGRGWIRRGKGEEGEEGGGSGGEERKGRKTI